MTISPPPARRGADRLTLTTLPSACVMTPRRKRPSLVADEPRQTTPDSTADSGTAGRSWQYDWRGHRHQNRGTAGRSWQYDWRETQTSEQRHRRPLLAVRLEGQRHRHQNRGTAGRSWQYDWRARDTDIRTEAPPAAPGSTTGEDTDIRTEAPPAAPGSTTGGPETQTSEQRHRRPLLAVRLEGQRHRHQNRGTAGRSWQYDWRARDTDIRAGTAGRSWQYD